MQYVDKESFTLNKARLYKFNLVQHKKKNFHPCIEQFLSKFVLTFLSQCNCLFLMIAKEYRTTMPLGIQEYQVDGKRNSILLIC